MASSKKNAAKQVISYRYGDKRKNNPHVGMVDTVSDGVEGHTTWAYDPHIDPTLNFDTARAGIENLIDDALASGDEAVMRQALEQLKRLQAPYLNWTGKAERTSFEVDTVSLHVHERIDPATILAAVQKRMKEAKGKSSAQFQPDLFAAPFENLPLREAIDFYKHERDWANRLIAGDSLLVMNSLLQKESMAGQVQMIYIDPPYGIKYGSNFQPFTNKRDVKDRNDNDLTQEPEMIKAFRDTWELGIHSYLSYLRDRLLLAKELLSESGSVFVQIGTENVDYVRGILDDIFDRRNLVNVICFQKTTSSTADYLGQVFDHIIWYAKDIAKVKFYEPFYEKKTDGDSFKAYDKVWYPTGMITRFSRSEDELPDDAEIIRFDNITSQSSGRDKGEGAASWFPVEIRGRKINPSNKVRWKTNEAGMLRLLRSGRLTASANSLAYIRRISDFPAASYNSLWTDTITSGSGLDKRYVVETLPKVIERCLLMTTDPGDLVLDPTCGSGTTAFVAEKWGRRWITTDTSRVAITLAKQRLMTASYDYYDLKYPHEGLKGGFVYKTVPHITLKSIANNPEVDEIYERLHPAIEQALDALNQVLISTPLPKDEELKEWEVPFEFPKDWPEAARRSLLTPSTPLVRPCIKRWTNPLPLMPTRKFFTTSLRCPKIDFASPAPSPSKRCPSPPCWVWMRPSNLPTPTLPVARSGETCPPRPMAG